MNKLSLSCGAVIFLLISCGKPESEVAKKKTQQFIHMSHIYVPGIPEARIDSQVLQIPLLSYDLVMLGGDITPATTLNNANMHYVDSVFHVADEKILWALGNHDYDNPAIYQSFSQKPLHYAIYHNGITFLVLDTQDDQSSFTGDQELLIRNVCDTIGESSHLVLIMHKLVWMFQNPFLPESADSILNGEIGSCFYCTNPNNFNKEIYPMLLKVNQAGIRVICIGGDIGYHAQQFEFISPDGILFLASGMYSGHAINKCIVFKYNASFRELTYDFKKLDDLIPD